MQTVLIVIHLLIVLALVVVVLLQRSEGGALGMGGGGGGLVSARGAANLLTRTTAILATGFFITSMALGLLARYGGSPTDILDRIPASQGQSAPAAGAAGGSLLDQLGGLPDDNAQPANAPVDVPSGATPDAPVTTPSESGAATPEPTPAPATADGVPVGSDVTPAIPANPGETAPNASQVPTVPPVESPAPAAAPADGTTTQ